MLTGSRGRPGGNPKFECIYVRPQNARAENQLRRNRSTQYFSFPDFKFDRLRKEAPGEYESYTDMALEKWIDVKIEKKGAQAKLFINGHQQPALVVNDLKHGPEAAGLRVDVGTEGYFSALRIRNAHDPGDPPGEPHTHRHHHEPLDHSHPHYPDIQHKHKD